MPRSKKVPVFSKVGPATLPQDDSELMLLAPDILGRIYKYYFQGQVIKISWRQKGNMKGRTAASPLLLTCKEIYHDAIKIYYATVAFQVFSAEIATPGSSLYRLPQWLKKIGPARKELINHIHIVHLGGDRDPLGNMGTGPNEYYCERNQRILDSLQNKNNLRRGVLKAQFRESVWSPDVMVESPKQAYEDCIAKLAAKRSSTK